jgi:hypothetical protein
MQGLPKPIRRPHNKSTVPLGKRPATGQPHRPAEMTAPHNGLFRNLLTLSVHRELSVDFAQAIFEIAPVMLLPGLH